MGELPVDEENRIARAARRLYAEAGRDSMPGLNIRSINRIPISSGLGSSAAAAIGGLVAAHRTLQNPLPEAEIVHLAL